MCAKIDFGVLTTRRPKPEKDDRRDFEEWYVDALFDMLNRAVAGAPENTDLGLLRMSVIYAFNEAMLGWRQDKVLGSISYRKDDTPYASLLENHVELMEYLLNDTHDVLSRMRLTYDDLCDMTFIELAALGRVMQAEDVRVTERRRLEEEAHKNKEKG